MRGSPAWAVRESELVAPALLAPPPDGPDVCAVCHGWARPGYSVCFACRLTLGSVRHPCRRVAAVSLYRPGGTLHHLLRGYKDGTGAAADVEGDRVAGVLARFLWERGPELCPDGWDAVIVVPSTRPSRRSGPHPLELLLARTFLAPQVWSGVLRAGTCAADHRRAADDAFVVTGDVDGAHLLLVDDTWTTGARAQSAASALGSAGASVEGIVVVGRVVTPVPGAPTGRWWRDHAEGRPGDGRPEAITSRA